MMEQDMKLPDGMTCGDCGNWTRCKPLIDSLQPGGTTCDFGPSRFVVGERVRDPEREARWQAAIQAYGKLLDEPLEPLEDLPGGGKFRRGPGPETNRTLKESHAAIRAGSLEEFEKALKIEASK